MTHHLATYAMGRWVPNFNLKKVLRDAIEFVRRLMSALLSVHVREEVQRFDSMPRSNGANRSAILYPW